MHVLIVIDHPDPNSFTHSAAQRFAQGAEAAAHTTELADLHAEGFNPLWTIADINTDGPENVAPDIAVEQARVARADAICLAFPLFWWGMPSMMKGWTDRVFSWGWAYDQLKDTEGSLLRPRTGVLLVPAGARSDGMEQAGLTAALETIWMQETFGFFGFSPRKLALLHGSKGSEARRAALLQRAHELGRTLQPPEPRRREPT